MSKHTLRLIIALSMWCCSLSALSIGRCGEPFFREDVQWQPVDYDNTDAGFKATLPGAPSSGLSGGDVYSFSEYLDVQYEIHCSYSGSYTPPAKSRDFVNEIKKTFPNASKIVEIASNQKKVKYIVEIHLKGKIARVYCSNNCLYWAIVEGDSSLAQQFFDSIIITR